MSSDTIYKGKSNRSRPRPVRNDASASDVKDVCSVDCHHPLPTPREDGTRIETVHHQGQE